MATGEISVRDDIGSWGISAQQFVDQLDALGNVDEIIVRVNSDGGSVFDGFSMLAALDRHPARIVVEIEGIAASAASYLALGADEVRIFEAGFLMAHLAQSGVIGNKRDMQEQAAVLDQIDRAIAGLYASRTGGDARDWLAVMEAETWFSADELQRMGLATIIPSRRTGSKPPPAAKARHAISNRSVRVRSIIDRLSQRTPSRPESRVREFLSGVAARCEEINRAYIKDGRQRNRERIVRNAGQRDRALRFLRWS